MFDTLKMETIVSNVKNHVWRSVDGNISWNYCFTLDVIKNIHKYEMVLDLLEDNVSKEVFVSLVKHRMTAYIKNVSPISTLHNEVNDDVSMPEIKDLNGELISSLVFSNNQYLIPGVFELKEGENVIDGGGYLGDSAIYFSQFVGNKGRVFSFEAQPEIAKTMRDNLKLNSIRNVDIIQKGLSDKVEDAYIVHYNQGSWVSYELPGDAVDFSRISLVDIDSFILENNISKIGLIKLDIEGSERGALLGAEKIIKRDKPKLAVSLYHKYDDFHVIPSIITNIRKDYRFYLRHNTTGLWETVLFAI